LAARKCSRTLWRVTPRSNPRNVSPGRSRRNPSSPAAAARNTSWATSSASSGPTPQRPHQYSTSGR
jgi:hypothetical protein